MLCGEDIGYGQIELSLYEATEKRKESLRGNRQQHGGGQSHYGKSPSSLPTREGSDDSSADYFSPCLIRNLVAIPAVALAEK